MHSQPSGRARAGVRKALGALCAACLLSLAPTASAADVRVDIRRADGVLLIDASAALGADPPTAWRVLTDYDRYAEFVPGMQSSRVVSRRGTRLTVTQSGEAPLWLMHMPVEITYEISEYPSTRIESRATAGIVAALDSTYRLTPSAAGVRLDYEGRLVPRSALLGRLEQLAVRQSVVRELQALADEIERSSGTVEHRTTH